ncbi:MAG: amino acid adenylation domain-containing protein [Phormidesmis sp.]
MEALNAEAPAISTRATKHWQQQVDRGQQPVALYKKMAAQVSPRTRRVSCELGPERTAALKELAVTAEAAALTPRISLFNLVAGLLLAYLHRVSGQAEVAIATPAHGRLTPEAKETAGLFVELFPLLAQVGENETFASLLQQVNESAGKLLRYAQPGASELAANRDVNVVLNFIHSQFSDFAGYNVRSEWIHADAGDPRHHLRLQVHDLDRQGSLQLHFDFNEDLFERDLQDRAPSHFLALVDAAIANKAQAIADVEMLAKKEKSHLFSLGNYQTASSKQGVNKQSVNKESDPDQSVVQLFEAQVQKTPNAIATSCESHTLTYQQLTYQQLNAKANQLAHYLRRQGVTAESAVGICLHRSTDMLVAILGVLKAGGAYVPIEPSHPVERISYILQDTQVRWVLTHSTLSERLTGQATLLPLDTLDAQVGAQVLNSQPEHNLEHNLENSPALGQLAYLLYTSGSTGQPKGVAIEHRGLANYVQWAIAKYVRGRVLSFPLFSPLAFDLTVTSIFVPLLSGGQVVVYPAGDEPIDLSLQRIFQENVVDVIKLTPSHLALVQGMPVGSRVKTLILGGEDFKSALAGAIAASSESTHSHPLEIYNEYGPTEATVGCMIHQYDATDEALSVPIGTPAANSEIYLLDEQLHLAPQGGVGEIFIGGPGLARGYLHREALTATRFVYWQGRRLYKTGDLGRWRSDGAMIYLGRCDRQVKIRGHRVELGEIEAAIAAHPAVSASAVSVVQPVVGAPPVSLSYCTSCGLASNYPGVSFDEAGVCDVCRTYETYRHRTATYFRSMEELRSRLEAACQRKNNLKNNLKNNQYDCMMLLSGGKDSTYALAQLVHMGFKVFAFTLDNGYISEGAKDNIRRVVQALEVEHIFATTPAMNEIFVDSLERHCNVCNGCFKTIYTLSMQMAYDMGIPAIVTGLSRGQFFETRLSEEWFTELFGQPEFNPDTIDETVLEARKVYHRSDDAVSQLMDVDVFQSDDIFNRVEIVDFYRYCEVELAEMLAFLRDRLPWIRPADTGRSTNCLINNAGIYVHTQQRGYHNYALPYSWDVRMGHKTVDECIDELNDEIDVGAVKQILKEIGYDAQRSTEAQLAAYYCVNSELSTADLRAFLAQQLPSTLVPAYFVPLDEMPLTANGKVDFAVLPDAQASRPELASVFVAPQTNVEKTLAKLWQQVLKVDRIGIHDNFFDLGGDSIMAIQIAARLSEAGFVLSPNQIFQHPTLAELAGVATPEGSAEPEDLTGEFPLTPIQQAFFELHSPEPEQFTQTMLLNGNEPLEIETLRWSVQALISHHDSLRLSYVQDEGRWIQRYRQATGVNQPEVNQPEVNQPETDQIDANQINANQVSLVDLSDEPVQQQVIQAEIARLQTQLNLATGDLLRAVLFDLGDQQQLAIVIHHLAVDAVSWLTLLKDLETIYRQIRSGEEVVLPLKTSSFKAWAQGLAQVELGADEMAYWESLPSTPLRQRVGSTEVERGEMLSPKALTPLSLAGKTTRKLSLEATQQFLQSSHRDRPQEKILAAIAEAISAKTKQSSLRVDLEGHGREEALVAGIRLVRTVGWFTSLFPVVLPVASEIGDTLSRVKETMRAVPQSGIGYGILRFFGDEQTKATLAAQPQADVLFNYLGTLDQLLPAQSMFELAVPLSVSRSERQPRSHPLDISAFITHGQLQIDIDYAGVDPQTVEAIANGIIDQLTQLITGKSSTAVTTEDFPLAQLDGQKLDKLSALLGQFDEDVDDDIDDEEEA